MAGTTLPGRLTWRLATVTGTRQENGHARTLELEVPGWPGHKAGQHVDLRLTAEDGYQAERSYSIASAPAGERIELTVETIVDGEVSPYLAEEVREGDQFELRGPIGGHFTWTPADGGPLALIGGGSGLVPLMAMLRVRAASVQPVPAQVLASFRTWDDMLYRDELRGLVRDPGLELSYTLTRGVPPTWTGGARRVDAVMLAEKLVPPSARPLLYVCGPTPFVEAVASALVDLGYDPASVRTERFGPTG
jgi:ferredoxin-NADP reductase